SIHGEDGRCWIAIPSGPCTEGVTVRSPVRAAFQMVETETGLQKRGEVRAMYPVQAIAFGKEAAILALGGAGEYPVPKGVVLVRLGNAGVAAPAVGRFTEAIRRVLARVGR